MTCVSLRSGMASSGTERSEKAPATAEGKKSCDGHPRALRILLAEDTLANQKLVKSILTKRGHLVEVAANGREAVNLVRQADFDLALMDVQMPQMDGLEAARQIRSLAHHGRTPIVAITANAFARDRADCTQAGMNDFIAKPFSPVELYQTLLRWMSGPGA